MKYKLIAIDIDDTLINDDQIITEGTKEALKQAVDKGVIVTLATGRMFRSAQKVARQINLNVPIITYQGAIVKNLLDEKILYERYVPENAAKQIFAYAEKHQLHLQWYYQDTLYAKTDNEKVKHYSKISNVPYEIEPNPSKMVHLPFEKLLIYDEPDTLDTIAKELQPILGNQVHITKSKPYFLEFIHPEGTKGQALSFLAAHFGVNLSEVIAVGDSWNDHDMLQVAGLGIAMENAVDSLKQIADEITKSNNDEGVRHVIEKYLL